MAVITISTGQMKLTNHSVRENFSFLAVTRRGLRALLTIMLGAGMGQTAGAFEIEPFVGAGLIYSDNITLQPDGAEEGDFAMQIMPGLRLSAETSRVKLDADANLQFIFYADNSDSNATFSNGSGSLDLVLIPEHLFLDTFAGISQTPVDPTQPLANSNIPITTNRTDRKLLQTNPRWESIVFNNELNLSYTIGKIDYNDPNLQDSEFQIFDSSYGSQDKVQGLGWAVNHYLAIYEYNLPPKGQYQTVALNVDYAFGNGLKLLGMYGLESDFLDYASKDLTDDMWSAGFNVVTEVIELSALVGDRSYGSTAFFDFRWNLTDDGFAYVSYSENPATTESIARQRENPDDPNIPETPPVIDDPGTGNAFINKRFQATLEPVFLAQRIVRLTGFYLEEQSDFVTQDDSLPPDDREQYGSIAGLGSINVSDKTQRSPRSAAGPISS